MKAESKAAEEEIVDTKKKWEKKVSQDSSDWEYFEEMWSMYFDDWTEHLDAVKDAAAMKEKLVQAKKFIDE